jgi:hypothetical protein
MHLGVGEKMFNPLVQVFFAYIAWYIYIYIYIYVYIHIMAGPCQGIYLGGI